MSRGTWDIIRHSKRFYVSTYRRAGSALVFSVGISLILSLAISHLYFEQPEHDFYSTDGVTPPISLTAMDEPNNTSYPLLANDQNSEGTTKAMPQ